MSEWKKETLKKFTEPQVDLRSYGSHPLEVLSQVTVTLAHDTHQVDAVVLVRKDAPHQLLLGTDVQSQ